MKFTNIVSRVITTVAFAMANKARGSASTWGTYQPKEPASKK